MRRRPTLGWQTFLAITLVALVVLLGWAGLSKISTRSFALGVPAQVPVATLGVSDRVCEGPLVPSDPADAVALFAEVPPGAPGTVRIDVQAAHGGRTYGAGIVGVTTFTGLGIGLNRPVPAHVPVRVCVLGLQGQVNIMGSAATTKGVRMRGGNSGEQFSVELQRTGQTLLSVLPRTFARASLWKLSWIGSWTFWLLTALLLVTIPLGALAVRRAEDDDADEPDGDRGLAGSQ